MLVMGVKVRGTGEVKVFAGGMLSDFILVLFPVTFPPMRGPNLPGEDLSGLTCKRQTATLTS